METTVRYVLAVLAFALAFPVAGGAQSGALVTGSRVRVTSPNDDLKRHIGVVTEIRGDSMVVAGRTGSRTIGLDNVTALEVSAGKKSRLFKDTAIGMGVGAVAGGLIGAVTYEKCEGNGFMSCFMAPDSQSESATWGAIALGTVGLVTGAIVGAFHRTDRWQGASLPARVSIGATRSGGFSVNLSRAF